MPRLVVASFMLALLGLAPSAADAARERQSSVLYEDLALAPDALVSSNPIDTSGFETVIVLGQSTGEAIVLCYFTDEPVRDPRDAAGVLAYVGAALDPATSEQVGNALSQGLLLSLPAANQAANLPPLPFELRATPIPVVADTFQCLVQGAGNFSATLVAQ
jgi:hypothetical protein